MEDGKANGAATDAYIAALEEGLMTVDACLAFAASDAGKAAFGDGLGEFKAHMESLKAAGATYCDCDACTLTKRDFGRKRIPAQEVPVDLRRRRLGL